MEILFGRIVQKSDVIVMKDKSQPDDEDSTEIAEGEDGRLARDK